MNRAAQLNRRPVVRTRQSLRLLSAAATGVAGESSAFRVLLTLSGFVMAVLISSTAAAELFDSLDAYPPRWQLDTSDCDARVVEHKNLSVGGADGGGCESLTFRASVGSETILVYPIEPVHAIDDVVATVSVMSAKEGAKIGLRVRFPYVRDPQTRRPVSKILYGASYDRPGKFQKLVVTSIERELRIAMAHLRSRHGDRANVADAYVDAIAINAYSGPGMTTLRVDQVSARGLVPIGDHGRVDEVPQLSRDESGSGSTSTMLRPTSLGQGQDLRVSSSAFPQNDLIRILEYHDEPLSWVRSLGFDAVLLSKPPTADLLREAIRNQLLVYAPPPVAPDPRIHTLLDPVMAWYLGGGVALDQDRVSQTDATVRRLRQLPETWQRPIVIAPVERWSQFAPISDALVSQAPPRIRRLPAAEQLLGMAYRRNRIGSLRDAAIAIDSSAPEKLSAMNRQISDTIGASPDGFFGWHAMFTQTIQMLEQAPRAIVFRSASSLTSGSTVAQQRSMALSYINRVVAMIAPWVAASSPRASYGVSGAPYRCGRLEADGTDILLLTSEANVGHHVLAGDGQTVEIQLPPEHAVRTAWRLSHFSAERIPIRSTPEGAKIEIVSPDVAEIVVISTDATFKSRLDQSASRLIAKASADRWQLCGDSLQHCRDAWNNALATGATDAIMPVDLITAAERTLQDAEAVFRAGDAEATLRLARRADAWANRASAQLTQALLPRDSANQQLPYTSCPPIDEGLPMLQSAWQPLMQDEGWSRNLLLSGTADDPSVLAEGGWNFGQREIARAASGCSWVARGFFSGRGAIRLFAHSTTSEPLGGGYEGTIAMLSSAPVKIEENQAVRIDAMIRTVGFGGPHQGVLVYDSLGGQEMGVLVRGATQWTPVRLYRQSSDESEVRVLFEVIGDGECVIDEVSVKAWAPDALPQLPLRPIN